MMPAITTSVWKAYSKSKFTVFTVGAAAAAVAAAAAHSSMKGILLANNLLNYIHNP